MIPRRTTMNFTSCSNTSNITETIEEYLQQLQNKTNVTMIPAVTMLCIFSVFGLAGNSLVLIVYSKKQGINSTKVLIIVIASFDLVANVAAIPMAIYTMFHTWHYQFAVVCKVTASLGSFTAMGGAMSLLVVAFIRYRKVCKPYGWQVTSRQAKISSLVAFLLAAIFSTPYFIIYGVRTRQTPCPNIQGSECFTADNYFNTIWPLLNNALFVMVHLFMSITLVVLYFFVGKAARMHSKRLEVSEYITQTTGNVLPIAATNKEETICCDGASINTSLTSATNMELAPGGIIQALVCCRSHPEEQKSLGDTQPSMQPNMSTTTFGENDKPNLQTDKDADVVAGHSPRLVFNDAADGYTHQRSQSTPTVPADENTPTVSVDHWKTLDVPVGSMHCHNNQRSLSDDKLLNDHLLDNAPHTMKHPNDSNQAKDVSKHDFGLKNSALSKEHTEEPCQHIKRQKTGGTLGRMTLMLIIISCVYVLGFLPFLILTIFKNGLPEEYSNMNMIEQTFYNLFKRLYFLNSAANPIIYILCNMNFRHDCINIVTGRYKKGVIINT